MERIEAPFHKAMKAPICAMNFFSAISNPLFSMTLSEHASGLPKKGGPIDKDTFMVS
jgi:hypothetical protein